ncbi:hypothetical protein GWI33_015757 [Rhynchophorus ferrugineus]|uniref:Uncharacterized protein n=1 Tax=Rhynchophorus ferrugineus TaxID=354439 RepID=A0A834I2Q7_RHYFE|nr:hypothetical protein GWI33_015757 [Rhynchophorus ferrugineus]
MGSSRGTTTSSYARIGRKPSKNEHRPIASAPGARKRPEGRHKTSAMGVATPSRRDRVKGERLLVPDRWSFPFEGWSSRKQPLTDSLHVLWPAGKLEFEGAEEERARPSSS